MNNMVTENSTKLNKTMTMEIRYERARHLLQGTWSKNISFNTTLFPIWIRNSNYFWYIREDRDSKEYRLVDAEAGSNNLAFDHKALSTALCDVTQEEIDANNLPITDVEITINPKIICFTAFDKRWQYSPQSGQLEETKLFTNNEVVSPDGKLLVFRHDHNLWLRVLETGEEKALTVDGEKHYSYGVAGACWGWRQGMDLQVIWSPDSSRIFTVQWDARRVKSLPIVHHVPADGGIRPTVEFVPTVYPGDEHQEELRLLTIDVKTGRHLPANYSQLQVTRNAFGLFTSGLGWWGKDNHLAYFVDVDKYYKWARVVEFNTNTGACSILFEETSNTHINLMLNQDEYSTILPLPETDELLWFSERTGWAHLYLYNLKNGELKNAVTSGPGLVRDIVRYVPSRREVFVLMAGRVKERNPYYRELVRVNIDTGEMFPVMTGDHDCLSITEKEDMMQWTAASMGHPTKNSCGVSRTGKFAVVTRSRADEIPVSALVDREGNQVMHLETADVSALPEGWQWPEPVKLTAADGQTDIYGLVYRPSNFDPNQSYPVVSSGFNQPEVPWVPEGSFTNSFGFGWQYLDAAALAELGFIVVQIDGRGSPGREKAFFDASYGWFQNAGHIDDHVAGVEQLAERYPYMDLTRVGFSAHTTGGSGAVQALLKHPEFYSVGVTSCFHDRRLMTAQIQGNKYEGPEPLENQHTYPEDEVEKLQGKLLLMGGMLDPCTPPAAIFRLVEALQKANKDFDLVLLPNLAHEIGGYLTRRAWDYLVRHLLGMEPPKEFKLD